MSGILLFCKALILWRPGLANGSSVLHDISMQLRRMLGKCNSLYNGGSLD